MEKVMIIGSACVIVSSLTPEEIDRFKLYDPNALTLTREGEESFSIGIDEGPGRITEKNAVYSRAKTAEGMATITILLDPLVEDKAGMVSGEIGASLLKLDELEKQIVTKNECIKEMEDTVRLMISQE